MDNAAIIAVSAVLEIELKALKGELDVVAHERDHEETANRARVLRESLPTLLAASIALDSTRDALISAMSTSYAEGVAVGSGKAVRNTGALMRPGKAFQAVRDSEVLLGSVNSVDDAASAVLARGKAVAALLKAQVFQDVADALDAARDGEFAAVAGEWSEALGDLSGNLHVQSHVAANTAQASGFGAWSARQAPDYTSRVSYLELYRVENRVEWRNWPERWDRLGGAFYHHGPADYAEGRMIAPADSKIWEHLGDPEYFPDATGNPYPPFAHQSGMGVKPVPAKELPKLGLAPRRPKARKLDFNASVAFSAELDPDIKRVLQDSVRNWRKETTTA